MTQAIFGLCGVLLGGLITAGVQERQRRIAAKANKRLAARVIRDELSFYRSSVAVAIKSENPAFVDEPTAIERTWREHRAALEQLSWSEWSVIQTAIVNALIVHPVVDGSWDTKFGAIAKVLVDKTSEAITALERHVK